MIKLMEMISPRPGVSTQYFHDHWRHPHASWGLMIKSVRAYTQCHRFDTPHLPAGQARFEGSAEIYFESIRDARGLREDTVYKKYVETDSPLFTNPERAIYTFVDEEVIQSAPSQTERKGSADFAWQLERRPVSIKLVQIIEEDGAQSWAGDDDLELGLRIGAARHVRARPNPTLHPDGATVAGFREIWWPTYTDFESGMARDPEALRTLLSRPARSYVALFSAERFPM